MGCLLAHLFAESVGTLSFERLCCNLTNMRAQLLVRDRIEVADDAVAHITIWKVPRPSRGSRHPYKYRLAYVVKGTCVLRFDNETGKGDHRHQGDAEMPYRFMGFERLLADFRKEIERWNHENGID